MDTGLAQKKNSRYAWVVFGVCFFIVFISLGFGSSPKSTYLTAVTEDKGWARSLFTLSDSCRYITTSILSFFFGAIVKKLGARKMIGFGFGFLILSMLISSFATEIWHFYISGAFLGAGLAWTTTAIVGHIVENWFTNSKGTLMGIILAANGLGGVASENVINRIIYGADGSLAGSATRWRLAYQVTAGIFAVSAVIALILIRNKPSDIGAEPLGQNAVKKKKRGLRWSGYEMSAILKKPFFYVSGVCVFFTGFMLQSMSNVAKPHMYDLGISKEYVIYVFSVHALVLTVSKISAGISYDKFGIRITFGFCCLAATVSLFCLSVMKGDSVILPWIYSIISSFAMPLETVMIPLLVSELFGEKSFSTVMGYYLAINTLGYACGVPLANLFYDLMGNYSTILKILTVFMVLIAVVTQLSMAAAKRDRVAFLKEAEKENASPEESLR